MTPHHIVLYTLVKDRNGCNEIENHPYECTGRRMSETDASTEHHCEPGHYEIRLKGHLADRWADWFGGLTIMLEAHGETRLSGPVVDQAALHGLLKKVRDLGMPIISVIRVAPGQSAPSPSTTFGIGQAKVSDGTP